MDWRITPTQIPPNSANIFYVIVVIDEWGLSEKIGFCISMFATDRPAYPTKSPLSQKNKLHVTKQVCSRGVCTSR